MSAEAPPFVAPMLAGATGVPDRPEGWIFEPKWDGVRAVGRVWGGQLTLASRLGNDVTATYPELQPLAPALSGHSAVLDGEIVAFDERGRPSFGRLQQRMHVRRPPATLLAHVPVVYIVFDLLWLDGHALTSDALVDRRRALDALALGGPHWQTSPVLPTAPDDDMLDACRQVGLEGYVGKLASSDYAVGRRSKAWTKIKAVRRREFVVGGWSEGSGGRSGRIGSLAVGWVEPGEAAPPGHPFALRYAGQVGSGLDERLLRDLGSAFADLATETSPFVPTPPTPMHFVRPAIVVEVAFTEFTTAGVLRQPSIKGVRDDLEAASVVWTDELS